MPYTINSSNGTIITDLLDNNIDRTTLDISLFGKNSSNYGELINENFVKLLENFANDEAPRSPIRGQLWFDTSENVLKIYNGNEFKIFARPFVSPTQPATASGDFWFNTTTKQLFFNDGSGLRLAGPIYTQEQGVSGLEISTIFDINGQKHTIIKLKIGNILIGIFNQSNEFSLGNDLGDTNILKSELNNKLTVNGVIIIPKGFKVLDTDFKFHGTALKAENLVDAFGTIVNTDSFVKTTGYNKIVGRLEVTGDNVANPNDTVNRPLALGWGPNLNIEVEKIPVGGTITPPVRLRVNRAFQNFVITTKKAEEETDFVDNFFIDSANTRIGINNINPNATLDVNGDVNLRANLRSNNPSITLFENTTDTINLGLAATSMTFGANSGTTTLRNNTTINKILTVNGGSITSTNTNFNLLNENTTTINIGGAASNINIGSLVGQVTFNKDINISGDMKLQGIKIVNTQGFDTLSIRNNNISSLNNLDLEIGVSGANKSVKLVSKTVANEELTVEKGISFSSSTSTIKVGQSFLGTFKLLNETVETISFGGETRNLNVGNFSNPASNVNILSKLQTYKDLVIGDIDGNPGTIRSFGNVANLLNTSRTIYMAQQADEVNIFGTGASGSFGPRQSLRTLKINATNTVVEGDLTLNGGDINSSVQLGSIFNNVQVIEQGVNASNILFGGSGTVVELAGKLQLGSAGSLLLEVKNIGGNIRGSIQASTNMTQFELIPQYADLVFIAPSSTEVQIGAGLNAESALRIGLTSSPSGSIPDGLDENGVPKFRTQFPVTISRHNLLVRNQILVSNKTKYPNFGIIFCNEWNELVAVPNLIATTAGDVTVGGNLNVGGFIRSVGANQPALFDNIRVGQNLELTGNLTVASALPGSTTRNIFTTHVTTLNIGGLPGTINLGGSGTLTKIPGRLGVGFKTITTNYDAFAHDRLLVDTLTGAFEIRLPPNSTNPTPPTTGDQIQIIDARDFGVNLVNVLRNGNMINGLPNDLTLNTSGIAFTLVYTGSTRGWCYSSTI